jgi:Domain of unknown function (DUF1905)
VTFRFTAPLWMVDDPTGWHFVTLPADLSDEIEDLTEPGRSGFGSVRVEVTVGSTTWQTSLFPDTKAGAYVLPMKKPVRRAEDLEAGDLVEVRLEVVTLS